MKIAVNTRLLIKNKLEGVGWFAYETLKRITQEHPEHQFYFLFDRKFDKEFIFSDNITPIVIGEILDLYGRVADLLEELPRQSVQRLLGDRHDVFRARRQGETMGLHRCYFAAIRNAPSRRMTVPLSIRFWIMCRTRAANSCG